MIGPLQNYQDVYVAACGMQLANGRQGRLHEKYCPACRAVIAEEEQEQEKE